MPVKYYSFSYYTVFARDADFVDIGEQVTRFLDVPEEGTPRLHHVLNQFFYSPNRDDTDITDVLTEDEMSDIVELVQSLSDTYKLLECSISWTEEERNAFFTLCGRAVRDKMNMFGCVYCYDIGRH